MRRSPFLSFLGAASGIALALSACATGAPRRAGASIDGWGPSEFEPWSNQTPPYLLYPGDEVDILVPSAPELSRQALVGPDGRISFPYIEPVMAANMTAAEVENALQTALARQLRRPDVQVSTIGYSSQKILVLGEVAQPGLYDLPGPMGALEAVAMAGGFTVGAARDNVSIIRRSPNGGAMRRTVNLQATLRGADGGDYATLGRYDVIYVPATGVANAGRFVQQYIRDLVPFNIGFSYALGDTYQSGSGSISGP